MIKPIGNNLIRSVSYTPSTPKSEKPFMCYNNVYTPKNKELYLKIPKPSNNTEVYIMTEGSADRKRTEHDYMKRIMGDSRELVDQRQLSKSFLNLEPNINISHDNKMQAVNNESDANKRDFSKERLIATNEPTVFINPNNIFNSNTQNNNQSSQQNNSSTNTNTNVISNSHTDIVHSAKSINSNSEHKKEAFHLVYNVIIGKIHEYTTLGKLKDKRSMLEVMFNSFESLSKIDNIFKSISSSIKMFCSEKTYENNELQILQIKNEKLLGDNQKCRADINQKDNLLKSYQEKISLLENSIIDKTSVIAQQRILLSNNVNAITNNQLNQLNEMQLQNNKLRDYINNCNNEIEKLKEKENKLMKIIYLVHKKGVSLKEIFKNDDNDLSQVLSQNLNLDNLNSQYLSSNFDPEYKYLENVNLDDSQFTVYFPDKQKDKKAIKPSFIPPLNFSVLANYESDIETQKEKSKENFNHRKNEALKKPKKPINPPYNNYGSRYTNNKNTILYGIYKDTDSIANEYKINNNPSYNDINIKNRNESTKNHLSEPHKNYKEDKKNIVLNTEPNKANNFDFTFNKNTNILTNEKTAAIQQYYIDNNVTTKPKVLVGNTKPNLVIGASKNNLSHIKKDTEKDYSEKIKKHIPSQNFMDEFNENYPIYKYSNAWKNEEELNKKIKNNQIDEYVKK